MAGRSALQHCEPGSVQGMRGRLQHDLAWPA
jgi:hypothetical protein